MTDPTFLSWQGTIPPRELSRLTCETLLRPMPSILRLEPDLYAVRFRAGQGSYFLFSQEQITALIRELPTPLPIPQRTPPPPLSVSNFLASLGLA